MDRRRFLLTSLAGVIGAPVGGAAQGADRVWRVGLLLGWRPPPEWIAGGTFFGPMRELGWVDGQNVVFEQRYDERLELLPMLVRELIASRVDVIVASPSEALRAAKEATATIPIVFAETSQPVRRGFVASLTRPGGNVTGLADVTLDLIPKRLELLKELVPGATRVAVLSVVPGSFPPDVVQGVLDDCKRASRTLGLRLETFEVRTSEDFDAAFARIRQSRAEGLTLFPTHFSITSASESLTSPSSIACRLLYNCDRRRRLEHSSPTTATGVTSAVKSRCTSTGYSGEPSQPTYLSRNLPYSTWSSTSRPPKR
jgi:putative ABC transport system substrate-binding protein